MANYFKYGKIIYLLAGIVLGAIGTKIVDSINNEKDNKKFFKLKKEYEELENKYKQILDIIKTDKDYFKTLEIFIAFGTVLSKCDGNFTKEEKETLVKIIVPLYDELPFEEKKRIEELLEKEIKLEDLFKKIEQSDIKFTDNVKKFVEDYLVFLSQLDGVTDNEKKIIEKITSSIEMYTKEKA